MLRSANFRKREVAMPNSIPTPAESLPTGDASPDCGPFNPRQLGNRAKKICSVYLIAICVLMMAVTLDFVAGSWTRVTARFELDYGEGIVMWQAAHVINLKAAYGDITHAPYIVFHYPPIYPLVSKLAAHWTHDLLIAGRTVSVISALLIGLIFGVQVFTCIPRRIPVSARLSGAFAAVVLVYSLSGVEWMRLMRVDLLGLAMTFGGLALFILGVRRARWQYAAFVLFCLALFTKQTLIAAPVACLIASYTYDRGRAWRLAATIVACSLAIMGFLWVATEGRILRHLFLYNENPLSVKNLEHLMRQNLDQSAALSAVAAGVLISYCLRLAKWPWPGVLTRLRAALQHSLYQRALIVGGLHLTLAFLVSLTAIKQGSNYNYFLEWNLAAVPLAGLAVGRTLAGLRRAGELTAAPAVLLLVPALVGLGGIHALAIQQDVRDQPYALVLKRIEQSQRPVYSEDMVLLNLAGKTIYGEPSILSSLNAVGTWDQSPLVNQIRAGFFGLIVQENPSDPLYYSPGVQRAIRDTYEVLERDGKYTLSVPRRQIPIHSGASVQ
jgi:hypothetical protein